jgi:glutamate-1-semialdehyde 2,1-aminomutase
VETARRVLPGGDTRASTFFTPHPITVASGCGSKIVDADGRELIDFLNNYSALVLGHADPGVLAAVEAVLPKGTAFSAAHESATRLGEEIIARIDAVERIRFCNSGTEASMWALRAARAFTGRPLIVKAYGGYHGSHEHVDQWTGGADDPVSGGLYDFDSHVLVVPYDDPAGLRAAIAGREKDVACVILEPVLGSAGIFAASESYLRAARAICDEIGALLVLDEVITFRLAHGGVQGELDVRPDLTVLGKLIGGGFPVGAFGGREQVMALFDPLADAPLGHAGTYNANPISMTAGVATLDRLDPPAYDRLNALGAALAAGLQANIDRRGAPLSITQVGSLVQLHTGRDPRPRVPGEPHSIGGPLKALHLALCMEGIHIAPRGFLNCSLAHSDEDIAAANEAFGRALDRIEPLLSRAT